MAGNVQRAIFAARIELENEIELPFLVPSLFFLHDKSVPEPIPVSCLFKMLKTPFLSNYMEEIQKNVQILFVLSLTNLEVNCQEPLKQ